MKAARSFVAATVLLIAMMAVGPIDRALASGDGAAEFGAGLTDIGPTATEALRLAFEDGAEDWLGAAAILLPAEHAAESDPDLWLDLCTQFSSSFEAAVGNANSAAESYLGKAWTGDLPKDWKKHIRDGRKFILYMANTGYKTYSDWATFAVWMKGYRSDKGKITDKITEFKKDFVKLGKLISKASITVAEGRKNTAKKLKGILKDVEKLEKNTIPNDLTTLKKYRKLVEDRTKDAERQPDAVKKKLEDAAKAMGDTVRSSVKVFPGAKGFAEEWARNGKELGEDYQEAYGNFVEAAKPIMGDTPPLWASLTQFEGWRYSEFPAKLAATRKMIQREITLIEGVPTVD